MPAAPLRRAGKKLEKPLETYLMRRLILATTALAFLSSTAFAQTPDKAGGGTAAPAAQSSDTTSAGDASKDKMAPKKKAKKMAKKSSADTPKQ